MGDFYILLGRNEMNRNEKKLHEILRVGGREFKIYVEYDESLGEAQPNYPDFSATPEYTDEGRPFARSISSACRYWKPYDLDSTTIGGCGACGWLYLESENDRIGICMCESLKQPDVEHEQNEDVCEPGE